MKNFILSIFFFFGMLSLNAQSEVPYYEIPDYPEKYSDCTVAARMIDGLGFRYYWATEGLRAEDLEYKPSESGRSTSETIDHLLGLSNFIVKVALKEEIGPREDVELSFEEKRALTLNNFKQAADILRESEDLSQFKIVINRGDSKSEFPFWNNINGPIADAIWHSGQIVVLRRASGNPFNSKASVFMGKVRD